MGGFLNIEIHQKLNSNDEFTSSLKDILKSALNQEQLMRFLNSVKLYNEENNSWFEYEKAKVKFHSKENNDQLDWDIYLYCNQNEYKYVLELSTLESEIQVHDEGWPYFDANKTDQILNLMKQIHRINEQALILFTDEASQGKFVEYLDTSVSDINYLFDLAILPKGLNWKMVPGKYEKIEEINSGQILKSKSRYMRNFENNRIT